MRRAHYIAAALAALLPAGCGGIWNEPLRVAIVKGRVIGADPAVGLALVRERTHIRSALDEEGRFELREVPAGKAELFIIASSNGAIIQQIETTGGQVLVLPDIQPSPAARLEVRCDVDGGYSTAQGTVTVVGTPFEQVELGSDERVYLGPMAPGCYEIQVSVPSIGFKTVNQCLEGGVETRVEVVFDRPGSGKEGPGCSGSGCDEGLLCTAEGRCVECTGDGHCAVGLTCAVERGECQGQLPACSSCLSDANCGLSGKCEALAGESRVCLYPCQSGNSCPEGGFVCQSGRCIPDPGAYSGCSAIGQVGMPCNGDQVCRDHGLVNGVCVADACTVPCSSSSVCPEGYFCSDVGGKQVCVK
jgi:hypothetical protein